MYGKLFTQMYEGTLASKGPWQALVTFQQLIILSDKHGVVDKTPDAISRITTIPLEIINQGIEELEKADPDSRTPDEDGRRIVRLSETRAWGWRITNYAKYREIRSAEERKEYHRAYWHKRKTQPNSTTQPETTKAVSSKQEAVSIKSRSKALPEKPVDVEERKKVLAEQVRQTLQGKIASRNA